jgi:predicted Holliday junction resolvase-like endonuclease
MLFALCIYVLTLDTILLTYDITDILLKVALNTINQIKTNEKVAHTEMVNQSHNSKKDRWYTEIE